MTHRATCRLPKKPSELIRIAIADLRKAEKSKDHRVSMETWHDKATIVPGETYNPATCKTTKAPSKIDDPCAVCLAGSVMAFTLKAPITAQLDPDDYPKSIENALYALNAFRTGALEYAFNLLGVSKPKQKEVYQALKITPVDTYEVASYTQDAAQFKRDMLALATKLEKLGL